MRNRALKGDGQTSAIVTCSVACAALATALLTNSARLVAQDKYVRLDPVTHDVDIAFPERLDFKDFAQNPGPLKTMTMVLASHSEPTFQTTVEAVSGTVTYRYVLRNGQTARQAINRIYMIVPTGVGELGCSAPPGWICLDPIATPSDERALYYVSPRGLFVRVATPLGRGNTSLKPGGTMDFELRSKAFPGFVRTYVESGFVNAPDDLPGAVAAELQRYLTIGRSLRRELVVGPAFPAGTRVRVMATSLENALRQLAAEGLVDRHSAFVGEALSILHAAERSDTSQDAPRSFPNTDVERDIDTVMRYTIANARAR
jgi:hypothetical protein